MFAEDAILLSEVVNDGLLVSVDPSGRRYDDQLPRARSAGHLAILCRMSFCTIRRWKANSFGQTTAVETLVAGHQLGAGGVLPGCSRSAGGVKSL
jgi:hypothetical protein